MTNKAFWPMRLCHAMIALLMLGRKHNLKSITAISGTKPRTPFPYIMDDMSSMQRLPSQCRCSRGFRLRYCKRFSVQRLRTRFVLVFRTLKKLGRRYGRALRLFGCRDGGKDGEGYFCSLERNGSSRVWLVQGDALRSSSMRAYGLRYVVRSNTFHAEAIADCLEFIKGTYSSASAVSHGVGAKASIP